MNWQGNSLAILVEMGWLFEGYLNKSNTLLTLITTPINIQILGKSFILMVFCAVSLFSKIIFNHV